MGEAGDFVHIQTGMSSADRPQPGTAHSARPFFPRRSTRLCGLEDGGTNALRTRPEALTVGPPRSGPGPEGQPLRMKDLTLEPWP